LSNQVDVFLNIIHNLMITQVCDKVKGERRKGKVCRMLGFAGDFDGKAPVV
jgi:hypothetical protein